METSQIFYITGYISSVAMIFQYHKVHCRIIIEATIYYYPPPQGCYGNSLTPHETLKFISDLIWI